MNDATGGATLVAEARWETDKAARYMAQLCKHFAHRLPVTLNERDGQILFDAGCCDAVAAETALQLRVSAADEAALEQLEGVVIRHLQRFAFRDLSEDAAAAIVWTRV